MPVNIQISSANFSLGPESGFFYTVSDSLASLVQVEADGTVVDTFPLTQAQLRNDVLELHYDGTFFWTLEELPSRLGMVIKKWRLFPFPTAAFPTASPVELRWQDELTLLNKPSVVFKGEAFAVEHYHRTFDGSAAQGASTIKLNDVSNITIGRTLYLGPSTFGGFTDNQESIVVAGINTGTNEVSFSKSGGLENSYISGDAVDFHVGIWFFNDHSYSGTEDDRGSITRFDYPSKTVSLVDTGAKYSGVTATDFDQDKLSFVRGPMILTLDITNPTFDLESSLEANLVESDKHTLIKVYDLISDLDNNLYYKLQQKETTEDLGTGTLTTTNFAPVYNFQTETNLPFVNSTSVRFEDTRFAITSSSPRTRGFTVFAEVRDQFNFPVLGRSVQFSSSVNSLSDPGTAGTLTPSIDVTNASGIATTTYAPSSTPNDILVDIQAEVL